MLQVGDQVVYPMHGAGVIADIEQCEVMGEVKSYYVLKMPIGSMKVMIPTDNVENIGLRDVISKKGVKKVAEVLADTPERAVGSWNKRFHATLTRMKSGESKEQVSPSTNSRHALPPQSRPTMVFCVMFSEKITSSGRASM